MSAVATTLLKKDSTAVYIGEQGKLPVVTAGKLTPDLLFDFKNGAFFYFTYKDLPEDKKVSCVAGGLQDAQVQTWYRLNHVAINAAGFANFMTTVCANWLNPGWEQEVKLLILSSSQGSMPVSDWILLLECTNALIKGTTCELNDAELRNHIQSHVHPDTMSTATHTKLHLIVDFPAYKCGLRTIDDACVRADELLQAAVKQMITSTVTATHRVNSRPTHNYTNNASSSNNNNNAALTATSSVTSLHVPALTSSKRTLLQEHEGCFKCRDFYADHLSRNCTRGFPDPAMYKALTAADATHTKKQRNKKEKTAPTAAVLPTTITTPVAVVMPSAVLSDGSDSEYVLAPFYTPHFFLDCAVGSSTASSTISIWALIDHGSDAVLIEPLLTNRLGLKWQKLPMPMIRAQYLYQ
jgi:hypothetical protein